MMKTDTGYEKRYYFGIDIGGTSVKAAVFDESDNTAGTYDLQLIRKTTEATYLMMWLTLFLHG